ncbi:MAG: hypothetical protein ABIQ87_00535 [Rubrivivax sp.]
MTAPAGAASAEVATAATAAAAPATSDDAVRARLRVLFRHSIRAGLVNPLLHLIPPYRLAEPAEDA